MLDIKKIEQQMDMIQRSINNYKRAELRVFLGTEEENKNNLKLHQVANQTLISQLKLTVTEFNDILKTL